MKSDSPLCDLVLVISYDRLLMEKFHIILGEAVAKLRKESSKEFTVLLKHGSMSIEYFSPYKVDRQTPHKQDEIYVIASGSALFLAAMTRLYSILAM